jgi:hypothetical protein
MRCSRKVSGTRYVSGLAYSFLQTVFDCRNCRAVCFQHTGAIQIVGDEVILRPDVWTKIHPVVILKVDLDDSFPDDACQNLLHFVIEVRLRNSELSI